ncbi:MAG: hypothetical protein RL492_1763 [Verrucomicrobiota bacterium]|jgi:hypothetical protein
MPEPIPFPSRRAAPPSGAGQPADVSSPQHVVPAVHPSNVVAFPAKQKPALGPTIIFPLWPWWL